MYSDFSKGFCDDIDALTLNNTQFRKVLVTTPTLQLVLMSVKDQIGEEVHPYITQFIKVVKGEGFGKIGSNTFPIYPGDAIIVPPNTLHNIIATTTLKLYTIYSPPNHPFST